MSYAIKCRVVGTKSWSFLSHRGSNRLRIHAIRFATAEKAQALIDNNSEENPAWEWKVVDLTTGKTIRATDGGSDANER
jgi:hypothetical protein